MDIELKKHLVIKYISCHESMIKHSIYDGLKNIAPEIDTDAKFDSELDTIISELLSENMVSYHIVKLSPHQPPLNPTNEYKPFKSYSLTPDGKKYCNNINDEYVNKVILSDEEKKKIMLDSIIKHINVNSTDTANSAIYDAVQALSEELPKPEWHRIYGNYAEYSLYEFFEKNGFVKFQKVNKNGHEDYEFNDRARKLVEIGNFEDFYKWEYDEKIKEEKRVSLGDIVLENHANIITWERKYKKAIQIATISISVLAFALSAKSYYDSKSKDLQQLKTQEQLTQLEERLHLIEATKNTPSKTDMESSSVSSSDEDTTAK